MNQEKKSSHFTIFLIVIFALLALKAAILIYKFAQKNYKISEHKSEFEKINLLIKHGYTQDLNKKDSEGKTPFWWACYNNDFELAKFLLENYSQTSDNCAKDMVNCSDNYGDTPLWWACFRNNIELVKLLLENGAQQSINYSGYCASKNNPTCANIAYNSTTGTKSNYGLTPAAWACKNNYTQIVKLLISNGAITDIPDNHNWLPIYCACCNGNLKIVKYLVKNNFRHKLNKIYDTNTNSRINTSINTYKNTNISTNINTDSCTRTGTNINTKMGKNNIFAQNLPYTPTPSNKFITRKFFSKLYYACWSNNLELINFTLFGPDRRFIFQHQLNNQEPNPNTSPNAAGSSGLQRTSNTPEQAFLLPSLYFAALSGNTQIIKYLIENYAD